MLHVLDAMYTLQHLLAENKLFFIMQLYDLKLYFVSYKIITKINMDLLLLYPFRSWSF